MARKNEKEVKEMEEKELRVTTIQDLEKYREGNIVELPPFGDGQPFVAKLKRPSMLKLVKEGKIPNKLLAEANRLFYKGGNVNEVQLEDISLLANTLDIMRPIVSAALIEPTLEDIEKAGMELSDDQMMYIFNYTQQGVDSLRSFRKE